MGVEQDPNGASPGCRPRGRGQTPRVGPGAPRPRYTGLDGRRRSAGSFKTKREAQEAIDAAYARPPARETVGQYAKDWTTRYPRSARTDKTNRGRLAAVFEMKIEGRPLKAWPFAGLRRRHVGELVDRMLRDQGRAATGAANRPADAVGHGRGRGLRRADRGQPVQGRASAPQRPVESSETKEHDRSGPIPPSCLALLREMPVRIDSPWLFPTPTGRLWRINNFYRDVWGPARRASGLECTPQDFRHSYVSNLSAAGIDVADLADVTGHLMAVSAGLRGRWRAGNCSGQPLARCRHSLARSGLVESVANLWEEQTEAHFKAVLLQEQGTDRGRPPPP